LLSENQKPRYPWTNRALRPSDIAERTSGRFHSTPGEEGRATGIEAAIREAAGALPADRVPRLVLLSDGVETEGSAARVAQLAASLGIPVDTVALDGRTAPRFRIDSAGFPAAAFTGERFPIDLTISSTRKGEVTAEIAAEGKPLGKSPLALEEGVNHVRVHASLNVPGAVDLSGTLASPQLGETRFADCKARFPRLVNSHKG